MHLIGPKCDQLGPITIVYLKSPNEKKTLFVYTRLGSESRCKQKSLCVDKKSLFFHWDSSSKQW